MKKPLMILSLVLLLCFTYTCQKGKDIIDSEADIVAIKSLVDEWYSAYYARDIDKILSFYTEDAIRMGHNEPKQVGKKAIKAALEEQMDKYDSQVVDDVEIDDRA